MEESTSSTPQPEQVRSWRPLLFVGVVVSLLIVASGALTGLNVFGRNISGTVTCVNGDVMGVFVEAERVPRIGSAEFQSGFADWRLNSTSLQTAQFDFWLVWGGSYSIHYGCGTLRKAGTAREWETDNRTPVIDTDASHWLCDSTRKGLPIDQSFTIVVTDCRQI